MAKKYYAVKVGLTPGVYETWETCEVMVKGYPGAKFKSFPTLEEACCFAGVPVSDYEEGIGAGGKSEKKEDALPASYAFVDGSYNLATGVYGYGGFLVHEGVRHVLQGSGDEPEMAAMRNVAGEVLGAMAAVELAVSLGIQELTVYYDYLGIEMWATGAWKRNKKGTIAYYDYMQSVKNRLAVRFVKVKGHSGVEGNEEADKLAKESVGIA